MAAKNEKTEKAEWDGSERRVSGVGDRRVAQKSPFQEYPKMLDGGVIVNSANDEKSLAKPASKEKK